MVLLLLVVLAFAVGFFLVFGGYFGATKLPGFMLQRKVEARLEEVTAVEMTATGDDGQTKTVVKASSVGPLPGIDRVLGGTTQGNKLARWIEQSGVKTTLSAILLVAFGLAAAGALVVMFTIRTAAIVPFGAAIGFALPFVYLKVKRARRMRTFEENFPEALDLIARSLKAGHAFVTGLKMVADEMDEPVGPEFRKTFDEQNFGLPLKDALENLTLRVPSLDVRFFATAVLIQRETGGNLSEILENLAHVVRERFKILRQVRVHTAHGRFTGYVLLALPAVLCVALSFINPDHMNLLFRERMGHIMLGAAVIMQTIGYFWIQQVVKIEV
jgi:tight adherence protein B